MDRFKAIEVFINVADHGGFAAGARHLAMSPPAVTRFVAGLEEQLGTRLFVRTTRSLRLTESGERFLEDARRILNDLREAEESAIGAHAAPRGGLRITAPVLFGRLHITPIIGEFLDTYPLVSIQTMFVDRVVSLMDEGLDVGIRIGNLPDSSISAIKVGSVRHVVFGATSYFKEHGQPNSPQELSDHKIIHSQAFGSAYEWLFQDQGREFAIKHQSKLGMNTNDAIIELVSRGWGLSRLLSYQIADQIHVGNIQAILTEYELPPIPIHVVHQEGRMASGKVRSFVDFAVERLRANPAIS